MSGKGGQIGETMFELTAEAPSSGTVKPTPADEALGTVTRVN